MPVRELPESLDVFVVFSMFRLASITAGVWRRGVEGNAADSRAGTDRISRALPQYGRDRLELGATDHRLNETYGPAK